MNRREVIQSLGLISSHALFPSVLASFLTSCTNKSDDYTNVFFTEDEMKTIIKIVDTIIPETKTKSASDVNTHQFLDQVFAACLTPNQQEIIRTGITGLISDLVNNNVNILEYLVQLDKKAYNKDENAAYFKIIKQYTLIGFFTSQEGTTKASNYVKIPDSYKGEIDTDSNTLNYGKTSLHYYL